jgi:hypothetical protein
MQAFMMGQANRNNELKVFDWNKAAQIIKDNKFQNAEAGLMEDWNYTADQIFDNNLPTLKENTYTYLASTWATPSIYINGVFIECYKMQSETPGWDQHTFWPEDSRKILSV